VAERAALLAAQAGKHARQRCTCAAGHGGSGRYVFLGPDGGHHRNSNHARRIFRPACDGRHPPANGAPGRLVIADAAACPEYRPRHGRQPCPGRPFVPPSGRGTQRLISAGDTGRCPSCGHAVRLRLDGRTVAHNNEPGHCPGGGTLPAGDAPLACWLPVRAPGPVGRVPPAARRHRPALPGPAARQLAGTVPRRASRSPRPSTTIGRTRRTAAFSGVRSAGWTISLAAFGRGQAREALAISSAAAQEAAGQGMSRAVPPAAVLPEHEQVGEDLARLRRVVQHRHHDHVHWRGLTGRRPQLAQLTERRGARQLSEITRESRTHQDGVSAGYV
jgi:hypothetical protein